MKWTIAGMVVALADCAGQSGAEPRGGGSRPACGAPASEVLHQGY